MKCLMGEEGRDGINNNNNDEDHLPCSLYDCLVLFVNDTLYAKSLLAAELSL